ncbi:MAG: pantoate kinase [Candidatus Bathyarchaeota archaeon]
MKKVKAFAPAHITGFFIINDKYKNLLRKGSLGGGFSLTKGVYTEVEVEKSHRWIVSISINSSPTKADVSLTLINELSKLVEKPYNIKVIHKTDLPVGAGYGTSGAGVLGLSLALNEALNLGLSKVEAAQLAHLAEIKCKTGLGTVIGETFGGFEVRDKAGAPGVGSIRKFNWSSFKVVSLYFSALPTKTFLKNREVRLRINLAGRKALKHFLAKPSVETFIKASRMFADEVNIYTQRLRNVLDILDRYNGQRFSMNMFGEALFTLIKEDKLEDVFPYVNLFRKVGGEIITSDVDLIGARIIEQ